MSERWEYRRESDSDLITASARVIIMMAAMMRQNRDRRQQDAKLFLISVRAL